MGKTITVGNLKGGTGKSTIAVNLACELAVGRPGRSVLLIDADAQGTATDWLTGGSPPPVELLSMPLMLARDAEAWVPRVLRLRARYDVIVVDLPPQVGSGIASALLLTDLFLVPVTPSGADLRATTKALELLRRARATRGGERPACMLVPSKVDRRTSLGRRATTLLDRFGLTVGPTVRQRAAHVEAFGAGQWIGAYAPGGAAHAELRALARAVERVLGLEDAPRIVSRPAGTAAA
ncbi:MAG TPA: ParA family protein [Geminicoccaceae bacterium]|nr:ParA family protein [Geminicoccaceae bacterium]